MIICLFLPIMWIINLPYINLIYNNKKDCEGICGLRSVVLKRLRKRAVQKCVGDIWRGWSLYTWKGIFQNMIFFSLRFTNILDVYMAWNQNNLEMFKEIKFSGMEEPRTTEIDFRYFKYSWRDQVTEIVKSQNYHLF